MNHSFADVESLLERHAPKLIGSNGNIMPNSGRRDVTEVNARAMASSRINIKEQQDYVRLSEEGYTPGEIADFWSRSPQAVRHVLRKHGARINSIRNDPSRGYL